MNISRAKIMLRMVKKNTNDYDLCSKTLEKTYYGK